MRLIPIPDLEGDGAAHAIAALMAVQGLEVPSPPKVRAIAFWVSGAGNAPVETRVGDQTVSAGCGMPVGSAGLRLGYGPDSSYGPVPEWDLGETWVYCGENETISITLVE